MPQRITSPEQADSILKQGSGGAGNLSLKDVFVNLKPDPATGVTEKTLRLVGFPVGFWEHSPQVRSEDNPKEYVKRVFLDGDLNKSFNRVCSEGDEKYGACAWCAEGYRKSKKFSWLCLERQDDGTSVVKILSKGTTIFEKFFEHEKFQRKRQAEAQAKGKGGFFCTNLGGQIAREVVITAESDSKALGGVKYAVNVEPQECPLTDDEVELLRATGSPTAEQLTAMYEVDPELKDLPEFFVLGYNLYNIHKYQAPRHPGDATAKAEATPKSEISFVAGGSNDNNTPDEAVVAPPKAKAAKATNMFAAGDDVADKPAPVKAPTW